MKVNVGDMDQILRIIAGCILLAVSFFVLSDIGSWVAAVIGGVLLATGVSRRCPAYSVFGISTRSHRPHAPQH